MAKTAFVTGGTRGIGLAVTRALSAQGYMVVAGYCRNEVAAMQMKQECGAVPLQGDLSRPGSASEMARRALEIL